MIVQRSKWLRGDLNGARFLDSDGNRDILGFYLKGKVDDVDLNDRIDILQAVYEGIFLRNKLKNCLNLCLWMIQNIQDFIIGLILLLM